MFDPIALKPDVEEKVLYVQDEGKWKPLGTESTIINKIKQAAYSRSAYIDPTYRDLYTHKEDIQTPNVPPGYHYVSPWKRYIGWYYNVPTYQKTEMFHDCKKFYTPLISRHVNKGIADLTLEDLKNPTDEVWFSMEKTFFKSSTDYTTPSTSLTPDKHINTIPLSPSNAYYSQQMYPVVTTELYNKVFGTPNRGKNYKETIVIRIPFKQVPEDCYFNWSICWNKGADISAPGEHVKVLAKPMKQLKKATGGTYFQNELSNVKEIPIENVKNGRPYIEGFSSKDESGQGTDYILHKVEKMDDTYLIAVEFSTDVNSEFDSCIGVMMNMYVPEERLHEYAKEWFTDFMRLPYYIEPKLGKVWNTVAIRLSELSIMPTFPKQGDILDVYTNTDIVNGVQAGNHDIAVCLGPYVDSPISHSRNPHKGAYFLAGPARYSPPKPTAKQANITLGGYDQETGQTYQNPWATFWLLNNAYIPSDTPSDRV